MRMSCLWREKVLSAPWKLLAYDAKTTARGNHKYGAD